MWNQIELIKDSKSLIQRIMALDESGDINWELAILFSLDIEINVSIN